MFNKSSNYRIRSSFSNRSKSQCNLHKIRVRARTRTRIKASKIPSSNRLLLPPQRKRNQTLSPLFKSKLRPSSKVMRPLPMPRKELKMIRRVRFQSTSLRRTNSQPTTTMTKTRAAMTTALSLITHLTSLVPAATTRMSSRRMIQVMCTLTTHPPGGLRKVRHGQYAGVRQPVRHRERQKRVFAALHR